MTRKCEHCGGPLPEGATRGKTLCSAPCRNARLRARRAAERSHKRTARSPGVDTDAIDARLAEIDRQVMGAWRERR